MTDHHDFGDHHDDYPGGEHHFDDHQYDDHQYDESLGFDDAAHHVDDPGYLGHDGDAGHDGWPPGEHLPAAEHHDPVLEPEQPGADDHAAADVHTAAVVNDAYTDPADVFPPPVDVGDLPEPTDGFPWIDPAVLGAAGPGPHEVAAHLAAEPVDPHDLAEYAGTELPPGADPWAVLAGSDDPATSILARFWRGQAG